MTRRTARPTRPARAARVLVLLAPALALTGCGGGGERTPSTSGAVTAQGEPGAQTATVVGGADLRFAPETVRAKVGSLTLTMRLEGGVPHNLVPDDKGLASIPLTTSGSASTTWALSKAATYGFECTVHDGMVGQVVVE